MLTLLLGRRDRCSTILVVYTVDEIEVTFKDTVVELFGVDAQSSSIGTLGQKSSLQN